MQAGASLNRAKNAFGYLEGGAMMSIAESGRVKEVVRESRKSYNDSSCKSVVLALRVRYHHTTEHALNSLQKSKRH